MTGISAGRTVTVDTIKTNVLDKMNDTDRLKGVKNTFSADRLYGKTTQLKHMGVQTKSHARKAEAGKAILQKAINNTIDQSKMSDEAKAFAKNALKNVATDASISDTSKNEYLNKANALKVLAEVDRVMASAEQDAHNAKLKANKESFQPTVAADMKKLEMAGNLANEQPNNRPQMMVAMQQGFVGPMNNFQAFSDGFSACSALVIYNSETGIGGLFHVPSPTVNGYQNEDNPRAGFMPYDSDGVSVTFPKETRADLQKFFAMVQPDQVTLYPGGDARDDQVDPEFGNMMRAGNEISSFDQAKLYTQEELKTIMIEVGVDDQAMRFNETQVAKLTVTAANDGNSLVVYPNEDKEGDAGAVNLLLSKGVMPEDQQHCDPYTVVLSHRDYENFDEVEGIGSKMVPED